jgi:hypothetical protein
MALHGTRGGLEALIAALWWGSLSAIGFLVVPMLFAHLPTPAMAGNMAARLFSAQTWVSLACGLLLLMLQRQAMANAVVGYSEEKEPIPSANRSSFALLLISAGMLLALLSEFAVAPRIVARDNLRLWHSAGTALYGLQWLCATAIVWRQGMRSTH